jgi:diguanylate cyclase (GGDEF)-like protein
LALYDTLTGLGNRNLFHIELARAVAVSQRKTTSFFLVMMDLDKFKTANDTFGHEAGDAILAAVGRRLRDNARAADTYFRLGGDEFVAILDAGSDGSAAARRITSALAEPIPFGSHTLVVQVSIGLAAYLVDGENPQDLIQAADAAMYDAKKANRARASTPGHQPV